MTILHRFSLDNARCNHVILVHPWQLNVGPEDILRAGDCVSLDLDETQSVTGTIVSVNVAENPPVMIRSDEGQDIALAPGTMLVKTSSVTDLGNIDGKLTQDATTPTKPLSSFTLIGDSPYDKNDFIMAVPHISDDVQGWPLNIISRDHAKRVSGGKETNGQTTDGDYAVVNQLLHFVGGFRFNSTSVTDVHVNVTDDECKTDLTQSRQHLLTKNYHILVTVESTMTDEPVYGLGYNDTREEVLRKIASAIDIVYPIQTDITWLQGPVQGFTGNFGTFLEDNLIDMKRPLLNVSGGLASV